MALTRQQRQSTGGQQALPKKASPGKVCTRVTRAPVGTPGLINRHKGPCLDSVCAEAGCNGG